MLAFFDSNIYIGELSDTIPKQTIQLWRSQYVVRLCPVVYHELLRGARERHWVDEIYRKTILFSAPTVKMWEEAALVLRQFTSEYGYGEPIFKLQNDILIALTARENGALLITADKHFKQIEQFISFQLLYYKNN